jgi:hypothetical protein
MKDLQLMLSILKKAHQGISLNSIVFRCPTHIYRSDSCPVRLGGYSHKGWAWWWYLTEHLKFQASNNLLEPLSAVILPWVDILAGCLKNQDCVLLMTDSTMAKGWLKKSNFSKLGEDLIQALVQIKAAGKLAQIFISLGIKSHSQWFAGKKTKFQMLSPAMI